MNDKKILTIIVNSYNSERFIGQCLDSVILDLQREAELIVIDDSSTDKSEKIIKELKPFYSSILEIELLDAYGNASKKPVEYYVHIENNLVSRRKIVDMILSTSFLDYCSDADNKFNIHIFNAIDKISTIEFLRKKVKISDVCTVGDGPNDIGMLKKYNGFIIGDNLMKYEDLSDIPHFSSFDDFVKNVQYIYKKKRNL